MVDALEVHVSELLRTLTEYPDRHVGGTGNRAATEVFASRMSSLGYEVAKTEFDCIEWEYGRAALRVGDEMFALQVGPYSLPCDLIAPLVVVDCVEALEAVDSPGAVLLLHGAITRGQIMPKNFTFYNPETHKRVIRALEAAEPAVVIAATGRDSQMVGSQYPFPLFEDGDLDIPNAYMRDVDGERLLGHAGAMTHVSVDSRRVPTTAEHVVATMPGDREGRIVLFAHIDSRKDSPGVLDNASGVATLLCVARLLADRTSGPTLEFVPLNGEDNYANPGEMMWVADNAERFGDIVLGINVDDAGLRGFGSHVSFYECSPEIEALAKDLMNDSEHDITEGPQWVQSDHALFGIYGVPAIAVTSAGMLEFMAKYAHSERDTVDLADAAAIAGISRFLAAFVDRLSEP
ncbi:MAG: M28 family peptidase [Actinobacteria bacterium]|nr:M28 family peptidase [Actinomycetota bacterium]MCG2808518.1 M28 family peptidase [Coriobacteriia bacterium]